MTHLGTCSVEWSRWKLVVVVVHFAEKVEQSLNALGPNPRFAIDENGFVHATSLVYDGVRNVRHAVLQNRVCRFSLWFCLLAMPLVASTKLLCIKSTEMGDLSRDVTFLACNQPLRPTQPPTLSSSLQLRRCLSLWHHSSRVSHAYGLKWPQKGNWALRLYSRMNK